MGLDRPQTVVAGRPPADLHPHPARGEVQLVVDDDHPGQAALDAEAPHQRRTALPDSFMYVVGTANTTRRPPMRISADVAALAPHRPQATAPWRSARNVDDLGTDVVARSGELLARVAEAHHHRSAEASPPSGPPVGRGPPNRRRRV